MPKLTVKQIEALKEPGRYSDGQNLYLKITPSGTKNWVLFYRFGTKRREMGIGSLSQVTLAEARKRALNALQKIASGVDPLDDKIALKRAGQTFGSFADAYLELHRDKFKSETHIHQWEKTLSDYCASLRGIAIADVDTEAVLKVLRPLWQEIPETASRIRGRLEAILDAAKAQELRSGDNPARWKGHLKAVLPARRRLTRGHHAALPYGELPAFMDQLHAKQSTAALALEFCVLNATRTSETLNCVWGEIDLAKGVWVIPAKRMKAGYEHRIPLSSQALEILHQLYDARPSQNAHVFPGSKAGKPLSNMSMAAVLKRMQRKDITVHGFRSTFRDWASEQTSFPNETCEHALAHRISDKAEASYRRGDQFEKRKALMEAWATYCKGAGVAGNAIPIRA
ncbi:MAG: integrase arm-type DNA-binding domain-containing protein [Aestuariivirga sp.]